MTLDGRGSSDRDGDDLTYTWTGPFFEGGGRATGDRPTVTLPLGKHGIDLTVEDGNGGVGSDEVGITIQDQTPPVVSIAVDAVMLWPPNHRMVPLTASLTASDVCSTPTVILASVKSSEPDNGEGDGDTIDDIQGANVGTADSQIELRAERAGGGSGRVYTAVYTAIDGAGNEARTAGSVLVPPDQGGKTDPIEITVKEYRLATEIHWSSVAGAESYNVIRGMVSKIRDAGPIIDLGSVVCLGSRIPAGATLRKRDLAAPNPGEAFFYLVEYDDGARSSYGEESAAKPRAAGPGDCR